MLNFSESGPGDEYKHVDPERLSGAEAQSQTTIHGWPSFFFGIPFAGIGTAGLLMMGGVIPVEQNKIHGPVWMIWIFAGFFLFAGLSLMWHGIKGVLRNKVVNAGKRRAINSPWQWDFPWNRIGFSRQKWRQPAKTLMMLFIFGGFLAPFNWWAFYSGEKSYLLYFIVGLFDLITIGIGGQFVYQLIRFFKYGTSRLLYYGFPFFLGDKMTIGLEGLPSRDSIEELELILRSVQERYEIRGTGKNRRSEVVCYQVYQDARKIPGRELPASPALEMQWSLPDDRELATRLSERPARFWELEVKAKTPGVDYRERFLLPVYGKS